MLTKITGFDSNQIDVAHRTSKIENAPIIMLRNKKQIELISLSKKEISQLTSSSFSIYSIS